MTVRDSVCVAGRRTDPDRGRVCYLAVWYGVVVLVEHQCGRGGLYLLFTFRLKQWHSCGELRDGFARASRIGILLRYSCIKYR